MKQAVTRTFMLQKGHHISTWTKKSGICRCQSWVLQRRRHDRLCAKFT